MNKLFNFFKINKQKTTFDKMFNELKDFAGENHFELTVKKSPFDDCIEIQTYIANQRNSIVKGKTLSSCLEQYNQDLCKSKIIDIEFNNLEL